VSSPLPAAAPRESLPPSGRLGTTRYALALIFVALAASGFAIGFRALLARALAWLYGAHDVVTAFAALPWWARILAPVLGGGAAGALVSLAQRGGLGQGVGDVMEAVVFGRVRLSLRASLLKSLASLLAITSGGSIGREGPLIQVGGAIGATVADLAGVGSRRARTLIAAGTAAGFAAAYNTPLAAVLFVLEVVMGIVALDAILPAIVAAAIATALTRALVGGGPIYGARAFQLTAGSELLAHALLGVLAGIGAQLFMRALSLAERLSQRSKSSLPLRAALGGACVGLLALRWPAVTGNGYEPLNVLLDGGYALPMIATLGVAKLVATSASVGSGSPGGVFTPTLFVGAALGACYGALLAQLFGAHAVGSLGAYALVGMAATTAATTHAPMMAAVLVFELSGDYAIVLPLLLATALATLVSRRLRRESIYTAELRARRVPWELTLEGRRQDASLPPP
jgi:CIC family chloride channel protein